MRCRGMLRSGYLALMLQLQKPAHNTFHCTLQNVEVEYKDRLEHLCQRERVEQARMARWGNREKARGMRLPHCEEIFEKFGYRYSPGW